MNSDEARRGRAWTELDMGALSHNVAALNSLLPRGCRLMPAVKGNAYGHGAAAVARELNELGVTAFCVAAAAEGAELRQNGVKGTILVLGYTPPELMNLLYRFDLIQTVVDYDYACTLNAYGQKLRVHVGVDTGMHRLGERCEDIDRLCGMFSMKNLSVEGAYTHLCADDSRDKPQMDFTYLQAKRFDKALEELKERGCVCPKKHLLSSYGLINYPELGGDYARVGIALYGTLSTKEDNEKCPVELRPALSMKTRVSSVRTLHPGEGAGYGLSFIAERETVIAALSVGYADGLPRALSDGVGSVLINGCRAKIVGKICMDQTLVDATSVNDIAQGDTAVIFGSSGDESISVCDVAEQAGTIANEILSRLGGRLERYTVK